MNYERAAPYVYPLFRIVFGVLYLCHGLQKFGLLHGHLVPMFTRLGGAAVIELACGSLIAIGLFTRPAAFIAAGEMAVAYWMVHAKMGFYPAVNMGEAAILFCFVFLYLAAAGPGALSIDSARLRKEPIR